MPVIPFKEFSPEIHESAFIAPSAWVTGKVVIGADSSILFGAVLRGDIQYIRIGRGSNVQDNAVIHTSRGLHDCVIGDDVTVGHGAILHGCTIQNRCIIGMGVTILDDAVIPENTIVGAQSLVTMKKTFPPGHLIMGSPAKVIRPLTERELKELADSAESYRRVSSEYKRVLAGRSF